MAAGEEGVYIQTSFFTKETKYIIEDAPFSLPLSSTRQDLSQLLCHLLSENSKEESLLSIDFDFLINGTLLRKTLGNLISTLSLALENVIQIEYIERNPPPSLESEMPHDDWVSAVQCNDNYILSGSYDYNIRIWSHAGKLISKCPGHDNKISDVAWLPRQPSPEGHMTFLSSSHDQHVHIWKFDPNETDDGVELKVICKGHSRSVEAIAVSPSKDNCKFVSGSWDKMLKVWSAEIGNEDNAMEEEEERKAKRANTNLSSKPSSRVPVATLSGHTHPITCIVWADEGEFYSCGYDHCIRAWDASTGINNNILNGSKVFLDIDKRAGSSLLVTGHTDRHVRIWDNRTDAPSVVSCTLSSHHGWVKRVRWSPLSDYQIVSGCYDNAARMWDMRSPKKPLYTIAAHNGKLLCLDWSFSQVIATGGADNMLRTFRIGRDNVI